MLAPRRRRGPGQVLGSPFAWLRAGGVGDGVTVAVGGARAGDGHAGGGEVAEGGAGLDELAPVREQFTDQLLGFFLGPPGVRDSGGSL
jgi:hypothetical protein